MIEPLSTAVVVFAIIIFFIVLMIVRTRRRHKELEVTLQKVAPDFSGQVTPSRWTAEPELHFSYRNRMVQVEFYTVGRHSNYVNTDYKGYSKHGCYTRLWIELPDEENLSLQMVTRSKFGKIRSMFATSEIKIDDDGFSEVFFVKGSDEQKIRSMLSVDVRKAIFELLNLVKNGHLDIRTMGSELRFQKLSWLNDPKLISQYIKLGLRVFDGYLQAVND